MHRALLILAASGYQDIEYAGTREGLEQAGFVVVIASSAVGRCQGKFGGSVEATLSLADVSVHDFDLIAFIGGPGAEAYTRDAEALRIAHDASSEGTVLGAICIAPLILAKAKVLEGKRATVWDDGEGTQRGILERAGAIVTGDAVTRDGMIVTGDGPDAASEFAKTLVAVAKRGA